MTLANAEKMVARFNGDDVEFCQCHHCMMGYVRILCETIPEWVWGYKEIRYGRAEMWVTRHGLAADAEKAAGRQGCEKGEGE